MWSSGTHALVPIRGSQGVHASLEDEHAPLWSSGEEAQLFEYKCVEFVEELTYGHLLKEPSK
jgi:hypothetical protein